MHEGTITVRLSTKNQSNKLLKQGLSPLTWVSEHWPWATRTREKSITLAASKAIGGIISNSTRFVPNGTAARKNRGGTSNSRKSISASQNASATSNKIDCTKRPISSLANWLKGLLSSEIFPNSRWSGRNKRARPRKRSESVRYVIAWSTTTGG